VLREGALVDELLHALAGREPRVVLALVADLEVVLELADVQQLAAAIVLAPHPEAVAAILLCRPRRGPRLPRDRDIGRLFAEEIAHLAVPQDSIKPLSV
jgi:hypothetical protein